MGSLEIQRLLSVEVQNETNWHHDQMKVSKQWQECRGVPETQARVGGARLPLAARRGTRAFFLAPSLLALIHDSAESDGQFGFFIDSTTGPPSGIGGRQIDILSRNSVVSSTGDIFATLRHVTRSQRRACPSRTGLVHLASWCVCFGTASRTA